MWQPLTKQSVIEDGYYWYRDRREAQPEIVQARMVFAGKTRELIFAHDYSEQHAISINTINKKWPRAQVSGPILPPI